MSLTNPWGFKTLRPACSGESYYDTITVDGSGSIAGWTLAGTLYDAAGADTGAAVAVTIADAANRVIQVAILNQTLDAPADYTLVVLRTDIGFQTQVCFATLEVTDPTRPNAWGQGF